MADLIQRLAQRHGFRGRRPRDIRAGELVPSGIQRGREGGDPCAESPPVALRCRSTRYLIMTLFMTRATMFQPDARDSCEIDKLSNLGSR